MHTEDLANAVIFSMNLDHQKFFSEISKHFSHINIGTGFEISIKELVAIISKIFKFEKKIIFDSSQPSGTPLKLLDSSRIKKLGWKPKIKLKSGLKEVINHYCESQNKTIN